jgi:hypothetical protein
MAKETSSSGRLLTPETVGMSLLLASTLRMVRSVSGVLTDHPFRRFVRADDNVSERVLDVRAGRRP